METLRDTQRLHDRCRSGLRGVLLAIMLAAAPAAWAVPQYTVVNLGTLGGGYSQAQGINGSGAVVGYSTTSGGDYHAFVYSGGAMHDLNSLATNLTAAGFSYLTSAHAINLSGQIVGDGATPAGYTQAFLATPIVSSVPEPGELLMMAMGLLAIGALRPNNRQG